MNQSAKEALLSVTIAICIFLVFRPKKEVPASEEINAVKNHYTIPEISEEDLANNPEAADAYMVLIDYIEAYNSGVPQDILDEINSDAKEALGLKVVPMADGTLSVQDINGKEVMYAD